MLVGETVAATEEDHRERQRAFAHALEHREAIRRLASALKVADAADVEQRIVAEMNRVGNEYEAWLRADTLRLQAHGDQPAVRERRARPFD
jgi:hypothetical protein